MAAARCHSLPPILLALTRLVTAEELVGDSSDRAVGALLGVLLCLALGLAVAWHHLCRLSEGRYHPRPMGRRALALLRGRWHRLLLRGHGDVVPQPCPGDGEVTAVTPRDEEEELMPWCRERRPEEEEEEEEGEAEAAPQAGEDPPGEGPVAGDSAEPLLGHPQPCSGTVAWGGVGGDTRPHLTTL